jgi:serine protease Do
VKLDVERDGRAIAALVKLAERPGRPGDRRAPGEHDTRPSRDAGGRDTVGLQVRDLHRDDLARLDLPGDLRGVLIARVEPLSPAFDADLERGQVVLEVNRRPVRSAAEFQRLVTEVPPGEAVTLYIYLPGAEQHALRTLRVDVP